MANFDKKLFSDLVQRGRIDTNMWIEQIRNKFDASNDNKFVIPFMPFGDAILRSDFVKGTTERKTATQVEITMKDIATNPTDINLDQDFNAKLMESMALSAKESILKAILNVAAYQLAPDNASGLVLNATGTKTRKNHFGKTVKQYVVEDIQNAIDLAIENGAKRENLIMLASPRAITNIKSLYTNGFVPANEIAQGVVFNGVLGTIDGVKLVETNTPAAYKYTTVYEKEATLSLNTYDNTHLAAVLLIDLGMVGMAMSELKTVIKNESETTLTDLVWAKGKAGFGSMYGNYKGIVALVEGN